MEGIIEVDQIEVKQENSSSRIQGLQSGSISEDASEGIQDDQSPNYAMLFPEYAEAAQQNDPAAYMYQMYYQQGPPEQEMRYFPDQNNFSMNNGIIDPAPQRSSQRLQKKKTPQKQASEYTDGFELSVSESGNLNSQNMEDDHISDEDDRPSRNRKKQQKGRGNIIKLVIAGGEKVELVQPRIKRKGMIGRPKGSKNKKSRDEGESDLDKPYKQSPSYHFTPKSDSALRFRKSSEIADENYTQTYSGKASPKHNHISEGNIKDTCQPHIRRKLSSGPDGVVFYECEGGPMLVPLSSLGIEIPPDQLPRPGAPVFIKRKNISQEKDENRYIGKLTAKQRKRKITKYKEKRKRRIWSKKINYDCRKRVADNRLRIKGRFVTKEQAFAILGTTPEDLQSNPQLRSILNNSQNCEIKTDQNSIKVRNLQALLEEDTDGKKNAELELKKGKSKAGIVSVTRAEPSRDQEEGAFKAPEKPRPHGTTHQELHFEVLSKNQDGKVTELKIQNIQRRKVSLDNEFGGRLQDLNSGDSASRYIFVKSRSRKCSTIFESNQEAPDKTFRIERPHPRKKVFIKELQRPAQTVARFIQLSQDERLLCRNLQNSITEYNQLIEDMEKRLKEEKDKIPPTRMKEEVLPLLKKKVEV